MLGLRVALVFLLTSWALTLPFERVGLASPPPLYKIDEIAPSAKPSFYSAKLSQILKHWPPATLEIPTQGQEILRAIQTPGNKDLIGMVKHFSIDAPLAKVVEVNERFEDYPKIWENVLSVQVVSRDRNRVVTDWVRKSPAFFLSKIKYRMVSVSEKSSSDRVIYRNQLIEGNMVHSSDSLVVFERVAENRTRVSVFNFFDPEVGPLRAIAEGKIWKQSLRTAYKDDVAFKARVEHPDWDEDRVSDEAEKALDQNPIDEIKYTDLIHFE